MDQVWDYEAACSVPPDPSHTLLVWPQAGQYALFDGRLAHGVLDAPPAGGSGRGRGGAAAKCAGAQGEQEESGARSIPTSGPGSIPAGARAAFLVNWWAAKPEGVQRMSDADVAAVRLSPPTPLRPWSCPLAAATPAAADDAAAAEDGCAAGACACACVWGRHDGARALPIADVAASAADLARGGGAALLDELLARRGVRLAGSGAVHAVLLAHPGLALLPVDVEAAAQGGGCLHAAAALLPLDALACSGSDESEGEQ